jgi:hypothetical protein
MYIYFYAEGGQGILDTVPHCKRRMQQNQGSYILYCLDTRAPYTFLFSHYVSIIKYLLIFRYRVRTKHFEESLWIKIISCQMLRTIFVSQKNNTNKQFLLHLDSLRDSFCYNETHTFYRFNFPVEQK